MQSPSAFSDHSLHPAVRGFLHWPDKPNGDALVLTHSAGSDSNSPVLGLISEAFSGHGYLVLRCDLPFRQGRRTGPPFPGNAESDRAGLHNAVAVLRKSVAGRIFLGGQSYGGRCSALPNPTLCLDFFCFHILCIHHANLNSFAFNICPICGRRVCSCTEREIHSGAWKR
jgi:hypothetical protein